MTQDRNPVHWVRLALAHDAAAIAFDPSRDVLEAVLYWSIVDVGEVAGEPTVCEAGWHLVLASDPKFHIHLESVRPWNPTVDELERLEVIDEACRFANAVVEAQRAGRWSRAGAECLVHRSST